MQVCMEKYQIAQIIQKETSKVVAKTATTAATTAAGTAVSPGVCSLVYYAWLDAGVDISYEETGFLVQYKTE